MLDLGAGTGNNMRATAPLLPAGQTWRLVDADATLLDRVRAPDSVTCERVVADLSVGIAPLLDPRPDLVTASALLDLAGAAWLASLADALAANRLPFYAVLSYTGREEWSPPHSFDAAVADAFHADQRRDKGLGAALGPDGHTHLVGRLAAAGYRVLEGPSDWQLEAPRDTALIAALADGTARAVAPALGDAASDWAEARRTAGAVSVSHRDLLALPPP